MKGTRFLIGVVLGIAVVLGVHYLGDELCIFPGGRHHRIPVGPHAKDLPKDEAEARISLEGKHQVTWQSTNKERLIIEFEKAKLPKGKDPFVGMMDSPNGKYRRVDCSLGDECRSGDVNPDLKSDVGFMKCVRYKYDQQLGDDRADGWIIIEK